MARMHLLRVDIPRGECGAAQAGHGVEGYRGRGGGGDPHALCAAAAYVSGNPMICTVMSGWVGIERAIL